MQGLDKQTYWEIIIHPNDFLEQFADFITQKTSCAIEFFDILPTPSPFAIIYDDSSWQSVLDFDIFKAKKSAQPTQIVSRIASNEINIQDFLESLHNFALILAQNVQAYVSFCYHIEEKFNDDWIRAYQDSIEPVQCGRFYIRPSWARELKKSQESYDEIIINPAFAFGSGHHASTTMCLEFLSEMSLQDKTLLDVGCGSGILSIASCKLGAQVYACDTDENAIRECNKNILLNGVALNALWQGSIADSPMDMPQKYDVIVANIVAFVVKVLHNDFRAKLAKNGVLILSGILDEYKFDIIKAFDDFKMLDTRCKDEWIALKLTL